MTIGATAALPFTSNASPTLLVQANANELAPGSYLWDPLIALSGPINMVVDLSSQRAFVYRSGKLIGISTISSGRPGHETPDGTFTVLEKQKTHHSNKYEDAPMPYMERLSWDGLALHGGHPRGYPASHGCIRLPMGFAAALFKENTRGMQVVITGDAPSREEILAARENAREAGVPTKTGNLHAAKFSGAGGPPDQAPCCAADEAAPPPEPSAAPQCNPDNGTDSACTGGDDQGQTDFDRPAEPALQPPPPPPPPD